MIWIYLLALLATLFAGWRAWRRLRYFLHIFQLEGYKQNEYRHWVGARTGAVVVRLSHRLALVLLVLAFLGLFYGPAFWTAVAVLPAWAVTFASSRLYRSSRQKKPLKYTARMRRLLAAAAVLTGLPVIAGAVGWALTGLPGLFWYLLGFFTADFGAPLWVLLASYLMQPVEGRIQEGFKRQARQHLQARPDLQVIGITGSYGKTSVKFIVAEILRQRFNVLASPSSYNTPMGLCLVINEMLRPEHQVLVLEMGMRYRGDIRELCEIARPDLSIVTTVGVAHLETMGSIENIAREKGDILQYMHPDGVAVLNVDNTHVAQMQTRAPGKVWRVSVGGADAEVTARDLQYGPEGASFVVRDETGAERTFRTQLLGEHNVLNILLGVAVGRAMGLRLRQIAYAVERVQPVEHRLQLRKEGAVTIIDDAFNANPVGARNAVEILGRFHEGRRVIVTPGMVELGERQWEENHRFGEHIARHVDMAVLVGEEQTRPIQAGLQAGGFPDEQVRVVASLFDAQAFLKSYLRPGDTVLYENDLPDQYAETG